MIQSDHIPTLARLLFVSTSQHENGHPSDAAIFREASHNNRKREISGVILRGTTWFCQVLEGHGDALEGTWDSIRRDQRHSNVRHWWQTDAPNRLFLHWHTEHWSVSEKIERVFLDILQSDAIPITDKITLVRAFAQVLRARKHAFQEAPATYGVSSDVSPSDTPH